MLICTTVSFLAVLVKVKKKIQAGDNQCAWKIKEGLECKK
jgi:hypothetical protein